MEKTPGCRYQMSKFVPFGSLSNYFGVNVGIWCVHVPSGPLNLPKILIFPTNFNDFINPFGVTLGCLWGHFAHFGITSGPLFGHFGITLGNERLFGSLWDHFGVTFGMWGSVFKKHSFCPIHVNDLLYNSGVNLRSLRGHVEVLWAHEGDFGLLGKVFGRTLGHADDTHTHFAPNYINHCSLLTIICPDASPPPQWRGGPGSRLMLREA